MEDNAGYNIIAGEYMGRNVLLTEEEHFRLLGGEPVLTVDNIGKPIAITTFLVNWKNVKVLRIEDQYIVNLLGQREKVISRATPIKKLPARPIKKLPAKQ